jgi:hypothetical protein
MRPAPDRGVGCFIAAFVILLVIVVLVGELAGYDMIQSHDPVNAEERWRERH